MTHCRSASEKCSAPCADGSVILDDHGAWPVAQVHGARKVA